MRIARTFLSTALIVASFSLTVRAVDIPTNPENFWIILMMGQSNMEGWQTDKIFIDDDAVVYPRLLKFDPTEGGAKQWVPATEPLVAWKGVGPGKACGKVLIEAFPDITIGLVSVVVGGSSVDIWTGPGREGYDWAISTINQFNGIGTLKAVMYHQGESNVGQSTWGAQVIEMINNLRSDFNNPDLPFAIGELGQWISNGSSINDQIKNELEPLNRVSRVSSEGLVVESVGGAHFSSASQRIFGKRYGEALVPLLQGGSTDAAIPAGRRSTPLVYAKNATPPALFTLSGRTFSRVVSASSPAWHVVISSSATSRSVGIVDRGTEVQHRAK